MQSIETRYLGPTNTKGARIVATATSGIKITRSMPIELEGEQAHASVAMELATQLNWRWHFLAGGTRAGYVFVRLDSNQYYPDL